MRKVYMNPRLRATSEKIGRAILAEVDAAYAQNTTEQVQPLIHALYVLANANPPYGKGRLLDELNDRINRRANDKQRREAENALAIVSRMEAKSARFVRLVKAIIACLEQNEDDWLRSSATEALKQMSYALPECSIEWLLYALNQPNDGQLRLSAFRVLDASGSTLPSWAINWLIDALEKLKDGELRWYAAETLRSVGNSLSARGIALLIGVTLFFGENCTLRSDFSHPTDPFERDTPCNELAREHLFCCELGST